MKQQLPALTNTPHPCARLPDGAKHAFNRMALGQQPHLPCPWTALLLGRGLVVPTGATRVIGWNHKTETDSTLDVFAVAPAAIDQWRAYKRSLVVGGLRTGGEA